MSNIKHVNKHGEFVEATAPDVAYQINMDDEDALSRVDEIKAQNSPQSTPSVSVASTQEEVAPKDQVKKPLSSPKAK